VAKNLDIEWCRMVKMTQKSFMLIIEFLAWWKSLIVLYPF
jgi:hypothetical protein